MTPSDYIACSALFVAVLAMLATFWQAHVARAYGRISVRPHLDWGTNRFPGRPISLYILNSGLGPAIVKSFALLFDGKEYPITELQLPSEIQEELMKISEYSEWNLFSNGTPIASGTQMNLITIENEPFSIERHNRAVSLLNRIGLILEYESMYEELFSLERRVHET